MKTYSAMVAAFIMVAFITACSSQTEPKSNKIGQVDSETCLLKTIETKYTSQSVLHELSYNADNTVSGIKKYVNDMLERQSHFSYDANKQLSKVEVMIADTLAEVFELAWFSDTAMVSYFDIKDSQQVFSHKELMIFNAEGEVLESATFENDSNNVWTRTGTSYLFAWEQNQLIGARNYVDEALTDSAEQNFDGPITSLAINDKVYKVRQLNPKFELFYDAKFTYSTINNPFRHLSIANVLPAVLYNFSTKCPATVSKKYSTGELITLSSAFESNTKNYPVNETVTYAIDDNGSVVNGKFERIYTYTNCAE